MDSPLVQHIQLASNLAILHPGSNGLQALGQSEVLSTFSWLEPLLSEPVAQPLILWKQLSPGELRSILLPVKEQGECKSQEISSRGSNSNHCRKQLCSPSAVVKEDRFVGRWYGEWLCEPFVNAPVPCIKGCQESRLLR